MTTVLYARVSTADQTIAHQETQAREAGFAIDQTIADEGISGRSSLAERPQGRRQRRRIERRTRRRTALGRGLGQEGSGNDAHDTKQPINKWFH